MSETKQELKHEWKPVCAICQFMSEQEKEPPMDDGCGCAVMPKKKKKEQDARFICHQERHLKLNYITGEKSPVPCYEWNSHGACREFQALMPDNPVIHFENNTVSISLSLGSLDGTLLYYKATPVSQAVDVVTSFIEYTGSFQITEDTKVEAYSILANSKSEIVTQQCVYQTQEVIP